MPFSAMIIEDLFGERIRVVLWACMIGLIQQHLKKYEGKDWHKWDNQKMVYFCRYLSHFFKWAQTWAFFNSESQQDIYWQCTVDHLAIELDLSHWSNHFLMNF